MNELLFYIIHYTAGFGQKCSKNAVFDFFSMYNNKNVIIIIHYTEPKMLYNDNLDKFIICLIIQSYGDNGCPYHNFDTHSFTATFMSMKHRT